MSERDHNSPGWVEIHEDGNDTGERPFKVVIKNLTWTEAERLKARLEKHPEDKPEQ